MSNLAVARSLVDTVKGFLPRLTEINSALTKSESATVKVAEVTEAIRKSDDPQVKQIAGRLAEISEQITALHSENRELRKGAQAILFPDTVVDDVDPDERKALIEEGRDIRKSIAEVFKAAKAVAPEIESELPDIPNVIGVRGRKPGSVSAAAGKPKPRVASITLHGEGDNGENITVERFSDLRKTVKSVTGVEVDNSIFVDAYLAAAETDDWSTIASGTETDVTLTVNDETGREVSFTVTAK